MAPRLPGSVPWGETMATGDHDPFSGDSVRGGASDICVSEARARAVPLRRTACTYLACAALNPYHVIVVRGREVNGACAREFSAWITSPSTQREIERFGVADYGEPLFFPNADKPGA